VKHDLFSPQQDQFLYSTIVFTAPGVPSWNSHSLISDVFKRVQTVNFRPACFGHKGENKGCCVVQLVRTQRRRHPLDWEVKGATLKVTDLAHKYYLGSWELDVKS